MGLTDDQIDDLSLELINALCEAFTNEEVLGSLVRKSLKTRLNKIKQNAQRIETTVESVVDFSVAKGKVIPLVIGALKSSSASPKLSKFFRDNFQKLLQLGSTIPLDDHLLTSLIKILTRLTDFAEIVLPAYAQTLPDLETSHPDLREQLSDNRLPVAKWLILLDLLLKDWQADDEGQLYIILFVQNLIPRLEGANKTALTQWLNDLPDSLRPTPKPQISKSQLPSERPWAEMFKNIEAAFVVFVEPLVTPTPNIVKYKVNAYLITRPSLDGDNAKITNIVLKRIPQEDLGNSIQDEPYFTIGEMKRELPEWLTIATDAVANQCSEIKREYQLALPPIAVLTVEFWLPFELLSSDIETWLIYDKPIELKEQTLPLGKQYQVVVRSYSRFKDDDAFNELNRMWQDFVEKSKTSDETVSKHTFHINEWANWESVKQKPNQAYFGLSSAYPLCLPEHQQQRKEIFSWVLRTGAPMLFWSRNNNLTKPRKNSLKKDIQVLLTDDILVHLGQLLGKIRQTRLDNKDHQLALWCDEPERLENLRELFRQPSRLGRKD